jgi:hypothetical protein
VRGLSRQAYGTARDEKRRLKRSASFVARAQTLSAEFRMLYDADLVDSAMDIELQKEPDERKLPKPLIEIFKEELASKEHLASWEQPLGQTDRDHLKKVEEEEYLYVRRPSPTQAIIACVKNE